LAQTTTLSLSIFCPAQLAVSEVDESQKQGQKQRPTAAIREIAPIDTDCFEVAVVFEFAFDLSPFETM
jgi:hypothetical protein